MLGSPLVVVSGLVAVRTAALPPKPLLTLWYFTVTLDPYPFWVYWVS